MQYYAAPMEGLTGHIFRRAHHAFFPGVNRYFTPFLTPNQNHVFSARELKDVQPANNAGVPVVPQLLTNRAEDFLWAADALEQMGYAEVNLNLGCPSPTVVTKGKGSGMLKSPEALNVFLDTIYNRTQVRISIKTRIGLSDPEEFGALIDIFNQYPISELIVHPRVQADLYKNRPRMEAFAQAEDRYPMPLAYNGDLRSIEAMQHFCATHPKVHAIMLGRGLIANPNLIAQIKEGKLLDKAHLKAFHDQLFEDYRNEMPGDRALLFKMRELWHYMSCLFPGSDGHQKKLKKASRADEYARIVADLFDRCELDPLATC